MEFDGRFIGFSVHFRAYSESFANESGVQQITAR